MEPQVDFAENYGRAGDSDEGQVIQASNLMIHYLPQNPEFSEEDTVYRVFRIWCITMPMKMK